MDDTNGASYSRISMRCQELRVHCHRCVSLSFFILTPGQFSKFTQLLPTWLMKREVKILRIFRQNPSTVTAIRSSAFLPFSYTRPTIDVFNYSFQRNIVRTANRIADGKMEQTAEDIEDNVGSFSLEDAHENLKDIQTELDEEIDELVGRIANNEFATLSECVRQDKVKSRHHRLMRGLLENLHHSEPRTLPLANTVDLYKTIVQDFTEVKHDMEKIISSIEADLEKTRKNIAYLKSNKAGLEKMTNACQGAIENVGVHPTYRKEIAITKTLFNEVKADLYTCVETIFPDNAGFQELLANFTQAYTKGGDDVYIDVEPENLTFAKYLIEADIAVYHRNDKSKIKMTDLL